MAKRKRKRRYFIHDLQIAEVSLVGQPAIILADEPSGNLDEANALNLHELLCVLRDRAGRSFLIATHNPDLARRSDRVFRIVDGRLAPETDGSISS